MDVVAKDGIAILVTRGAPPSTAALEQSWDAAAALMSTTGISMMSSPVTNGTTGASMTSSSTTGYSMPY